jgi:pyruvate dehydrogenase E1 component alpha subunit
VAAGIPGVQVDGNDVFAVRAVVAEALATARRGGGPALIEALTYRLSDHTTADDAGRYRSTHEVEEAWKLEPLSRLREYLYRSGAWSKAQEQALLADCARAIDAAVGEYLKRARPSTDAMFEHLFATMPPHLKAQRATARKYGGKPGAC